MTSPNARIDFRGPEDAVEAARKAATRFSLFGMSSFEIKDGSAYKNESPKDLFDCLDGLTDAHPDVVFTVSVVDAGERHAETWVLHGDAEIAHYVMPDDKISELGGDRLDEPATLDVLSAMMDPHAEAAFGSSAPTM